MRRYLEKIDVGEAEPRQARMPPAAARFWRVIDAAADMAAAGFEWSRGQDSPRINGRAPRSRHLQPQARKDARFVFLCHDFCGFK